MTSSHNAWKDIDLEAEEEAAVNQRAADVGALVHHVMRYGSEIAAEELRELGLAEDVIEPALQIGIAALAQLRADRAKILAELGIIEVGQRVIENTKP